MIVTTNAGPVYRDPAIAIANCVNATLLLIFIPIRKLHLLYLSKNEKPEVYAGESSIPDCSLCVLVVSPPFEDYPFFPVVSPPFEDYPFCSCGKSSL